jgi:hypothetical protein
MCQTRLTHQPIQHIPIHMPLLDTHTLKPMLQLHTTVQQPTIRTLHLDTALDTTLDTAHIMFQITAIHLILLTITTIPTHQVTTHTNLVTITHTNHQIMAHTNQPTTIQVTHITTQDLGLKK